MEVAIAVPAGIVANDVAVSLVGQRSLSVRVGERSLSVQLPAPGDPGACQAELRGAGLYITVGALPAATAAAPAQVAAPAPAPAPEPEPAVDGRRAERIAAIEQRLGELVGEAAEAAKAAKTAGAAAAEAHTAGERRQGQLNQLQKMVQMDPAALSEMAGSVGAENAEAFVAKMERQLEPLRRHIATHAEEEDAARAQQARAKARAQALEAERASLAAELEQHKRAPALTPAAPVPAPARATPPTPSLPLAYSLSPAEFVDCSALTALPLPSDSPAAAALAERTAAALGDHGYAICNSFADLGLVEAVRREIGGPRLTGRYEDSEIWVGKEAGVGAQLTVKSVRGDRVLWLADNDVEAGGHGAVAQLIARMDAWILGMLSPRLSSLSGLKERTDAMFAIYPGGGAKFTQHIDNTARDGRRLTVLCYLNAGAAWADDDGGALRVHKGGRVGAETAVRVLPEAGRLAMFYADSMPHEVALLLVLLVLVLLLDLLDLLVCRRSSPC